GPTHADDQDGGDPVRVGEPVDAVGELRGVLDLVGQPGGRAEHVEAVEHGVPQASGSKLGPTPSASAFAISRSCSLRDTDSASSMTSTGMPCRIAYRRWSRGL